jgi:hypothetical protein
MYDRAGLATCQNELKPDPPSVTYATRHRVPLQFCSDFHNGNHIVCPVPDRHFLLGVGVQKIW